MIHVFDGAMGTMLQAAGLPAGYCPEQWNIEQPEKVIAVHRAYVLSGADIIETNTFGANRIKLSHYGLSAKVAELNTAAVQAAKKACGPTTKIAGSVSSTGKLVKPLGELDFDTAYDVYLEQITALSKAGVDFIIIETMIDIQEMRAALLAAKAATNKPIICQLSYGADGRTLTGTDPKTAAIILEAMGANIIGANCSLGPAQMLPIVKELASSTTLPISIQPNAGMPELIDGKTLFPMTPAEMGSWAEKLIAAGATYVGGCCGTTPKHIANIKKACENKRPAAREMIRLHTAITSRSKTIYLGKDFPTTIIGERINPTGRKALAADIREGHFIKVKQEAIAQLEAGASILDVNMGVPGIDQTAAMQKAIEELSTLVDAPLAIDTTDPAALEAGLKAYPGRALINSVSAEPERLESFLPLAKKYGAAILCLPIAPGGVPATAEERVAIIKEITAKAITQGMRPQDFVLDALVMTVAANSAAAKETLHTLKLYREQFGYPSTMGLSNISYGLPRRDLLNSAFCAMSIASGLDAPILNPYDKTMQDILAAAAVINGHDASGKNYSIRYAPANDTETVTRTASSKPADIFAAIRQTVLHGEKEAVVPLIRQALAEGHSSVEITEEALTAAMNEIGKDFGTGRVFLPQVLLAAETMRAAFQTIKEVLPNQKSDKLGTVILATVKGDIHDLGKNIVAALMENNGFEIIDLGKDVDAATIVKEAAAHNASIVGLCALMTTTLPQIDHTIAALKAAGSKASIIVGGAVLTEEYAKQAGANAYAPDGVAAVNKAKELLGKA
ncbi:MAG: homocysteine S-methyltransferase family protein [Pelosinus sp.]|nr:homocysteine S-methyltransferase family protein [Pelosinus sp.]